MLTSGYKLCRYVIHAVGTIYDGNNELHGACSSSRIRTLESCYRQIVKQLKEHLEIKRIAIPILGSGSYKFPFELATRIAIATVGNELIDWYKQDPELFGMSNLEKVYFFTYDVNNESQKKANHLETLMKIKNQYEECFKMNQKVVIQNSFDAHMSYCKEIKEYDKSRGYFSIAKSARQALMMFRLSFLPLQFIKDMFAGINWEKRRALVERITVIKAMIPVILFLAQHWGNVGLPSAIEKIVQELLMLCILYFMFDTVTYLMSLIIMADIQKPSANIIRSIILFFVNYIEVSLDMSYLYYVYRKSKLSLREALCFGILGDVNMMGQNWSDYGFMFLNAAIKFFFLTVAFGYFSGHMKQREFRS